METIKSFKLGKTGIIIIIMSVVIVALFIGLLYVIGKRQQEIELQKQIEEIEKDIGCLETEIKGLEKENELFKIFDYYRSGRYANAREAIAASGLSTGQFYRKLKEYETAKQS